jgi:hypothetical protein
MMQYNRAGPTAVSHIPNFGDTAVSPTGEAVSLAGDAEDEDLSACGCISTWR